tara:strand:- start:189 stop:986 length:798 start_codon:yes stop_codon:yes gene_type:complete
MIIRLVLLIILLTASSDFAVALTPGEIYKKNKNNILENKFLVFDEQLFIVIHLKTKASEAGKRALFVKMKTRALRYLLPRFAHYQFPDANTAWFDLYFSEPINSRFTIRQAFVIDKKLADGEAYLVLTVPQSTVESYIPDIKVIKTAVNRSFDEGKNINLKKYLGLVKGKRLIRVQETIIAKISKNEENKKKLLESPESKSSEKNYQATEASEGITAKEQLKKPIECVLPLCKKMKTKDLNKDHLENSFEGTTIRQSNELDDFFD